MNDKIGKEIVRQLKIKNQIELLKFFSSNVTMELVQKIERDINEDPYGINNVILDFDL